MRFSNILFDLDGTLTDPKEGITKCIQYSLAEMGIHPPAMDTLHGCIGPPLKETFARWLESSKEKRLDQAIAYYRRRFTDVGIYENTLYPQIPQTLNEIRRAGYTLYLATSKPHIFARRILDHFQLSDFFHNVYGSELDGRLSDKADLIAHLLHSENLSAEETLMIGDRIHDIVGGKKNGVWTAAVSYGYGSREEIQDATPDLIFDTPRDIARYLSAR